METRKILLMVVVFVFMTVLLVSSSSAKKLSLPTETSTNDKIILEYEFKQPIVRNNGQYDRVIMSGLEPYLRVGAPTVYGNE